MKKLLTESDVIRLMHDEWHKRLCGLCESSDAPAPVGEKKKLVSTDLKVVHRDSGVCYTVVSIGRDSVCLRTPEGDEFVIDDAEFQNYNVK